MQRIAQSLLGLTLVLLVIFSTGCGDDTTGGGGTMALEPTISLAGDAGFVSFDQDLPFATPSFSVRVNVNDGDNPLNTLTITQDGSTIPFGNLVFDGGATTSQNPFLITGADQSGTTYDIQITPTDVFAGSTANFTFTVTDQENLSASTSLAITYTSIPASIVLGNEGLTGDSDVSTVSPSFDLDLDIVAGDANIASIAFLENGTLLTAEEIRLRGATDPIAANPVVIDPSVATFEGVYTITAAAPSDGATTYTVEVTDDLGVISSQTITVNYFTPEVTEINGILLNQGGDVGTGGLDLDTGMGTGSNDAAAEIQDEGIDLNLTAPNNWRQQISAANDATLRVVDLTQLPDDFSFDGVTTLAEVRNAYDTGSVPAGDDTSCNCSDSTSGEEVTEPVMAGDLFAVLRDGNYYLIRVDAVNVTDSGNGDSYELSVKK